MGAWWKSGITIFWKFITLPKSKLQYSQTLLQYATNNQDFSFVPLCGNSNTLSSFEDVGTFSGLGSCNFIYFFLSAVLVSSSSQVLENALFRRRFLLLVFCPFKLCFNKHVLLMMFSVLICAPRSPASSISVTIISAISTAFLFLSCAIALSTRNE